MSAADFSETVESALPISRLQDSRTDFNVVFIHSRLDDYGLTPPQFRVYAHLARRAGSGAAWPAVATIAATCRLDPKTVRKALRTLVSHKLIHRKERPSETTLYTLAQASDWQPPTHISGQPHQSANPPAKWEGIPTNPHGGQPYQRTPAEGNPSEDNPMKKETCTTRTPGIPRSEDEAVEQGKIAGVPPEFARVEFCRLDSVGWVNGAGNPVRKWVTHLRKRWADDQSQRAERQTRAATRPGRSSGFVPPRNFGSANYQQPVEKF